ncbi:MAG: NUDIX domain-containing protein, partial [bacterium]
MSNRKAVSIILTNDPDSTSIYLVKRSPKLKFFGGFYACPGGTLDANDGEIDVKKSESVPTESLPYIVAATREIFEETGVLLSRGPKMTKDALSRYRQDLLDDKIQFREILEKEGQTIEATDFHFICSILTPEFSPIRYDTEFYWVTIPDGQSPEIWEGELVDGRFMTAVDALQAWKRGELLIVPPIVFMLNEFIGRTVREAVPFINDYAQAYRRGKIHQVYFTPGVQLITLKTRTLPPATHT